MGRPFLLFASCAVASGSILKSMSARSLAAAGVPDPTCRTGVISLKVVDSDPQVCCAGYCGECNDYPTCSSVRGQASKNACCASSVYSMRCGNAPANVCLESCSKSVPPCIMDRVDLASNKSSTDAADDCNKAVQDWRDQVQNAIAAGEKSAHDQMSTTTTTTTPTTTTTTTTTTTKKCKSDIALNFNDQPLGKCPSGWTCKGSNIKVCWHGGHNGNCYDGGLGGTSDSPSDPRWFYAGNDQDTGEAQSDDFVLPKGVSSMTVLRAGMSDWHHKQGSGIWLKSAADDSVVCDLNENVAGWRFKKVKRDLSSCKGLASHAGKLVYIFVKNGKKGGWGKLFFDDIRFVGADGAALNKGGSIVCD